MKTASVMATVASLLLAGTAVASAQSYVVEPQGAYLVQPGYVEAAPVYGTRTIVVPAEPTIAVPSYVAPRTVVVEPRTEYVAPSYTYPPPSRYSGYNSVRYIGPSGCIADPDGYCY